MGTRLNQTTAYYAGREPPSLFWEMTVSECLATRESPYQRALERPAPYGEILARFLEDRIGLDPSWSVVEVGGGYGRLMASFLEVVPVSRLTMVDVSPEFTRRQRRALEAHPGVGFVTADILDCLGRIEEPVDLVISNENLGDLPTAVSVRKDELLMSSAATWRSISVCCSPSERPRFRSGRSEGSGGRACETGSQGSNLGACGGRGGPELRSPW